MAFGRRRFGQETYIEGENDSGNNFGIKRRRHAELDENKEKLENLMLQLGIRGAATAVETNLQNLVTVLEADLDSYKPALLNIIVDCTTDIPERRSVYSTLSGLLNAKNYNFGGELVEALMRKLFDCLKTHEYDMSLNIIIMIADLVNTRVVSYYSCMGFFENLLSVLDQPDVIQVQADFYVWCILNALPCVAKTFNEKKEQEFQQMIQKIDNYLRRRTKLHLQFLRVWSSDDPLPQLDYLDCLFAQLLESKSQGWPESLCLLRHYLSFESIICDALQHNLGHLIPPLHVGPFCGFGEILPETIQTLDVPYPLPKVVFRLFEPSDCPEEDPSLPAANSLDRFLIERDLAWIIEEFHFQRKKCAQLLMSYSRPGMKFPLNYMVLEVVFGQLFMQPRSQYLELFLGSLLIELCKLQPNTMPQVLAQTAEILFQRLDSMQIGCLDRFVSWFSYHLSNFQYRWLWEDWDEVLLLGPFHPKRIFVEETLQKCMRLSYHQRVSDEMPARFEKLVPKKPVPNFRFKVGNVEVDKIGAQIAHDLSQSIRNKSNPESVLSLLNSFPLSEKDYEDTDSYRLEILILTLLNLGSKSLSHSFAALVKYLPSIKYYTDKGEQVQMACLNALHEFWNTNQQIMVVLADKLLKMQLVDCSTIITWVFSENMRKDLHRSYLWEIVVSAIKKLSVLVNKIRKSLQDAEERKLDEKQKAQDANEMMEYDEVDEKICDLQKKLSAAQSIQHSVYLSLIQRFTIDLAEHLLQCEAEGKDFDTDRFRLIVGRLRQVFMAQHEDYARYTQTMERLLFTSDVDPHILEIFHQFCSLRR